MVIYPARVSGSRPVKNTSGSNITAGTVCYVTGASGQQETIAPFDPSATTGFVQLVYVEQQINADATGTGVFEGTVTLDTSSGFVKDQLAFVSNASNLTGTPGDNVYACGFVSAIGAAGKVYFQGGLNDNKLQLTPRMLGAAGDGTTDDSSQIAAADTFCAANGLTLIIDAVHAIATTMTISSRCQFVGGGKITVSSGQTVTMGGVVNADGQAQIFDGLGTVVLSANTEVYATWFGAVGDDATDCNPETGRKHLTKMRFGIRDASVKGIKLIFPPGTYRYFDPYWFKDLVNIHVYARGAKFRCIGTGATHSSDRLTMSMNNGLFFSIGDGSSSGTVTYDFGDLIDTVSSGSYVVTTSTAADAGDYSPGDNVLIYGLCQQADSFPPNPRHFEFRKVAYRVAYDNEASGPFQVGELLIFGGGGLAKLCAFTDSGTTGTITFEMLEGSVPADNETIEGESSGCTANVNGTPAGSNASTGEVYLTEPLEYFYDADFYDFTQGKGAPRILSMSRPDYVFGENLVWEGGDFSLPNPVADAAGYCQVTGYRRVKMIDCIFDEPVVTECDVIDFYNCRTIGAFELDKVVHVTNWHGGYIYDLRLATGISQLTIDDGAIVESIKQLQPKRLYIRDSTLRAIDPTATSIVSLSPVFAVHSVLLENVRIDASLIPVGANRGLVSGGSISTLTVASSPAPTDTEMYVSVTGDANVSGLIDSLDIGFLMDCVHDGRKTGRVTNITRNSGTGIKIVGDFSEAPVAGEIWRWSSIQSIETRNVKQIGPETQPELIFDRSRRRSFEGRSRVQTLTYGMEDLIRYDGSADGTTDVVIPKEIWINGRLKSIWVEVNKTYAGSSGSCSLFLQRSVYSFAYDNEASGPFTVGETVTFGRGGTGVITATASTTPTGTITFRPVTYPLPLDNESISGGTSGATASLNGALTSYDSSFQSFLSIDCKTAGVREMTRFGSSGSAGADSIATLDGIYHRVVRLGVSGGGGLYPQYSNYSDLPDFTITVEIVQAR